MSQSDDFSAEIDPDLAAQMGFSAFASGTPKPAYKKRKIDAPPATAANSTPLAARPSNTAAAPHGDDAAPRHSDGKRPDGSWDWAALRAGIRLANGDVAYFDKSFIEDPWEKLNAQAQQGGG